MGDFAIVRAILVKIGIQQDDRLPSVDLTLQHVKPGTHPHLAPFDGHRDLGIQRSGEPLGLPGVRMFRLPSLGVDFLAEIAGG